MPPCKIFIGNAIACVPSISMHLYLISIVAILTLVFFVAGLFYRIRYAMRGESNSDMERRQSERVPLNILAEILAGGGQPVVGRTLDLSLTGVFVTDAMALAEGSPCEVCLMVAGRNAPIRLRLRGRVARVTAEGVGVEFTAMSRECYDNLSYIIRYNQTGEAD